jgi:Sulfotransferase family
MSEMLGFLRQPWSAGHLIDRARRRMGLTDFGDIPFEPPLQTLLHACREEADLSLFGRAAIRWDTLRFLSNLLRLRDEEKRAPEILDHPVASPLVIAGLPRSGTTFLHSLLAEDRSNLVPRVWQAIHPYPETRFGTVRDRRMQRVARQLRMFQILAPQFRHLHPIEADSPQECSEITAHVFTSLRFDTTYHVPSYRRWVDDTGHLDAYCFHKRFLQHLQYQAGRSGSWALKCPDHIFALSAIREVYPDARLVFVHRDPLAVLASVARLTEVLRRPFTRRIDQIEIGRQDSDRWLAATDLMIAAADEQCFAEPIFHIHYAELIDDPTGTICALYTHFGRSLESDAATRIGQLVAAKPNGGYRGRRSRLEDYGLDPAREQTRFARYMARFAIQSELGPGSTRSARSPRVLPAGRSSEPAE